MGFSLPRYSYRMILCCGVDTRIIHPALAIQGEVFVIEFIPKVVVFNANRYG